MNKVKEEYLENNNYNEFEEITTEDFNEAQFNIKKLEEQNLEMLQTLIYVLKETCSACQGSPSDMVSTCFGCTVSKQVRATIEKTTGEKIEEVLNETNLNSLPPI